MYLSSTDGFDLLSAFRRQRNVLFALMLRNMRTKFLGNGLGYLIAIGWPLSHIIILVMIYSLTGRVAPYGDSIALFVATGVVPFQTFSYISRFMMLSLVRNRPLLSFPEIKVLDMLFASALLEIISACSVVAVFMVIAWCAGIDPIPRDVVQASYAFGACIILGLGFGILNGVIVIAFPPWFTGYMLLIILLWVSSGIIFVPDALPAPIREIASYQPVLQLVEWMRSAYYQGYGDLVLDQKYPIILGLIFMFLGLLLERAIRGRLLAAR